VRDAGRNASAATPHEAARDADAILFAVHWSRFDDVLSHAGNLREGDRDLLAANERATPR
jgi:predicted dinucleotide-binding enzyme